MSSSPEGLLTLYEAADRLGVHYMTVYRYVRTGRLPGRKLGVEWRVDPADLEAFEVHATAPGDEAERPDGREGRDGAPARPRRKVDHARRLADRLVVGDEPGSWAIVQNALAAGTEPADVYLNVITPALHMIGDGWAGGTVTIGQEHQASVVVHRLIGRLGPQFARRGRKRGTVVLGAPAGDPHALPSALFADLLRGDGFSVVDLGGDTPSSSFVGAAVGAERLLAVGISATIDTDDAAVAETIAALRRAVDTTIVLGGGATTEDDAARLGADCWGGAGRPALALFSRIADDARRTHRQQTRRDAR